MGKEMSNNEIKSVCIIYLSEQIYEPIICMYTYTVYVCVLCVDRCTHMVHVGVCCVGKSICAHICGETFTYNICTHGNACMQKSGNEVEFPTPFSPEGRFSY